jgi:magnesium-transporting ATPase (P-type)
VLGHWDDLAVIAVMLFINAGVGFWQEFKADNAHREAGTVSHFQRVVLRIGNFTS